jgi:hypothetical protein
MHFDGLFLRSTFSQACLKLSFLSQFIGKIELSFHWTRQSFHAFFNLKQGKLCPSVSVDADLSLCRDLWAIGGTENAIGKYEVDKGQRRGGCVKNPHCHIW